MLTERCCICGRFVSWDADRSTSFGDTSMTDPPDPNYYCGPCAAEQEEEAVRDRRLPDHWVVSQWERRAAQRIGMVHAGPKMAAWGGWYAPSRIPADYVLQEDIAEVPHG